MGMMNEIPISSKEPKGGKTLFLQDAGKCSILREVQALVLHLRWSRFGKDLELGKSVQMTQKENGMN